MNSGDWLLINCYYTNTLLSPSWIYHIRPLFTSVPSFRCVNHPCPSHMMKLSMPSTRSPSMLPPGLYSTLKTAHSLEIFSFFPSRHQETSRTSIRARSPRILSTTHQIQHPRTINLTPTEHINTMSSQPQIAHHPPQSSPDKSYWICCRVVQTLNQAGQATQARVCSLVTAQSTEPCWTFAVPYI